MQMNVALAAANREQAELLRQKFFPHTDSKHVRDSYVFDHCIYMFRSDPSELLPFFDEEAIKEHRMITIKGESHSRLKTIASLLGKPLAATFRAIIAYSVAHIDDVTAEARPSLGAGLVQELAEKTRLLAKQLSEAEKTLSEIQFMLGKEG